MYAQRKVLKSEIDNTSQKRIDRYSECLSTSLQTIYHSTTSFSILSSIFWLYCRFPVSIFSVQFAGLISLKDSFDMIFQSDTLEFTSFTFRQIGWRTSFLQIFCTKHAQTLKYRQDLINRACRVVSFVNLTLTQTLKCKRSNIYNDFIN